MARATSYVLSGKVRVKEFSPTLVKARVQGGAVYVVALRIDRNCLRLSCDCPAFDSQGPCKHLWATLVVAEKQGILRQLSPFSRVASDGDYEDDDDDIDDNRASVAPRAPFSSKYAAPMPEWKSLLNSARSAPTTPETRVLPVDSEIVYVVDAEKTMSGSLIDRKSVV